MRFAHLIDQVFFRPWLITPTAHAAIRRILVSRLDSRGGPDLDLPFADLGQRGELNLADFVNARPAYRFDENRIAHVSVSGVIGKGLSKIERSCGAVGVEDIHADLDRAEADGAAGILLEINSPGGTVTGVPELADRIRGLDIPTVAFSDDLVASAAYYLAAGADSIVASRSADIGSIGVYIPWIDSSAAWESQGYRADPIINEGGIHKAAFFGPSLTDDQRANLQAGVDETFADFKGFVTAERDLPLEALTGACFSGARAEALGLTDFVGSVRDAYAILLSQVSEPAAAG